MNPILATDSYKPSHPFQLPPGMTAAHSYIEARSKKPGLDKTVFAGMQPFSKGLSSWRNRVTHQDVDEAAALLKDHGVPFAEPSWRRVVEKHGGFLPVEIRAVREGTVVPNGNVLVTVDSTDPELPWIGGHLEPSLLRAIWYSSTVATRSYMAKLVIKEFLEKTADDLSGLPFKLHDFGSRGVSSQESAVLGGIAHLYNFYGTDTLEAIASARILYNEPMAGFSIPASEHFTITTWGRENEAGAYRNMLESFGQAGKIFACVSDSYNIFDACANLWGGELRQAVIDSGATLVIRPDSGDPTTTILSCLNILGEKFGTTLNSKGFKVLKHVRLIQGDGLDGPEAIRMILTAMYLSGWSADNIAFGMGGGLLQNVTRDTLGFAMKCSAAEIDGEWRDVYKDPVAGGKTSKRGRLTLMQGEGGFETVRRDEPRAWGGKYTEALELVYSCRDGEVEIGKTRTLTEVRSNTGLW